MKILLILLSIFATACLFWLCKSVKYKSDSLPVQQLRWGSGGGYTGSVVSYILLDNGQIFKKESLKEGPPADNGKTKSRNAEKLIASARELVKMDFNHPGNIYYFVELQDSTGKNTITWGAPGISAPDAAKNLYNQLNALIEKK